MSIINTANVNYEIVKNTNCEEIDYRPLPPAAPELAPGMIPIKWDGSKWVKADPYGEWYDYDKQEWANVVLVSSTIRDTYKNEAPGIEILETNVLAYLVWIPRYRYKLFNVNSEVTSPQEIEIIFENKNRQKSNGSKNGEWLTHPAFTFGDDELNGIWVGKFETTENDGIPTVKPGMAAIRGQNISSQFTTSRLFNDQTNYGLTSNYDAHMMKNIEWGAVAYLSHSKYGKYGNSIYTGANKEIYQNKSIGYITGSSNGTPSQEITDTQCPYYDTVDREDGTGACGAGASTTGNIYGVYDMSGGASEHVMGALYNSTNSAIIVASSGFGPEINSSNMEKYIDKYAYNTSEKVYEKRHLGDATGETWGWYNDEANFIFDSGSNRLWFIRGYYYGHNVGTGMFFFFGTYGDVDETHSFRLAVSGYIID